MNSVVLDILQSANPWLDDPDVFPESAVHRIPDPFLARLVPGKEEWPVSGNAYLVIGARQVGKSSLLWHWFARRGIPPLFINAEEPAIREWCRSPTLMLKDLNQLVSPETPVLVDEAQHLAEAGLLVKGLIDGGLNNPLFVTGSSTFHLHSRTRESLAGRAVRVHLHPLSLAEIGATIGDRPPLLRRQALRQAAGKQLTIGSYPGVWLGADPEGELRRLVEAYVVRDASDLFRIKHLQPFRQLLRIAAGQVGSLVNASEWSAICGISRGTVMEYLDLLEQTQIVFRVPPFVGGKRAEVTSRPKVFFCDNGIRNLVSRQVIPFEDRADRGPCLENWVAAELRKHLSSLLPMDTLHFWRSKSGAEVDFVLERPDGLIGIEVKATALRRPALSRSAHSFIQAYEPVRFMVVNLGAVERRAIGKTEVRWVSPEALADPEDFLDPNLRKDQAMVDSR